MIKTVASSAHTDGPWKIDGSSITAKLDGEELQIALLSTTQWMGELTAKEIRVRDIFNAQKDANARLIAAAPELLEACKALLDARKSGRHLHGEVAAELIYNAEKAIAKAEGRYT